MSDFGDRIKKARKHAQLSQVALGRLIGMAQGSLSELESVGNSSTYTVQIARECRVNPLWLATGDGNMTSGSYRIPQTRDAVEHKTNVLLVGQNKRVPRLAWYEVEKFVQGMLNISDDRYEVVASQSVTERCFLVELDGDAMVSQVLTESIPPSSLLLCDPARPAESGDVVVALHPRTGEAMARRLIREAGVLYLKANNPAYPMLEISPDAVIARAIEVITRRQL